MEQSQDTLQGAELEGVLDEELLLDDLLEEIAGPQIIDAPELALGCWGRQLCGEDHICSPGFLAGHGHFKNKFCDQCRSDGILISSDRICLARKALHDHFNNSNGRTIWTKGARLVNQTAKCTGPPVLIFKGLVPEAVAAMGAPVPDSWLCNGAPQPGAVGDVRFLVSKGTLVPSGMSTAARKGKMRPAAGSSSTASSSAVADQAVAGETMDAWRNHAVKRARGDLALPPLHAEYDASLSHDACSTSAASASPPHVGDDGDAGHLTPYPWTFCEPSGMLEPMAQMSQSQWFHSRSQTTAPPWRPPRTSRRSLLASHDALEQQIHAVLASVQPKGGVDTVSEEATDDRAGLCHLDPGQLGAEARPSLTSREVQALSSLLPMLRSSAALLRSGLEPSRPPTASTFPPSPPSSRHSTASACLHDASDLEDTAVPPHRGSTSRDAQTMKPDELSCRDSQTTREVFTQTPVRIDYTKGGVLVVAYVLMGMSFSSAGSFALALLCAYGDLSVPDGFGTAVSWVVSALLFNLGVIVCSCLLGGLGLVDDRTLHVLRANSYTRFHAARMRRRKMRRHAVMDEETTDVYSDDIKANQRRLDCLLNAFLLVCLLLLSLGIISHFALDDVYASNFTHPPPG